MNDKKATWNKSTDYPLAMDVVNQEKRKKQRWFIAWVITLAMLIATNIAWLYFLIR